MKSLRQRGKHKEIPNIPVEEIPIHVAVELPYDILVIVLRHLAQLEQLDNFFSRCAGDLANNYIELPVSPLSRHFLAEARRNLRTIASVSHVWREAALPILEEATLFSSSRRCADEGFRCDKVRVLRWMTTVEMERAWDWLKDPTSVQMAVIESTGLPKRKSRISTLLRRKAPGPASDPEVIEEAKPTKHPLALDAFINVQVLLLSGSVMEELQQPFTSRVAPLSALKQLKTLILCNYDAKDGGSKPVSGRALNMEDVVHWVKGSHITSLELFDPIIVPGYIPDEITSADFPETLTSLLLFAYTTYDAPSFSKFMKCFPSLRSLTIVPAISTQHHDFIRLIRLPPQLETLTILGASMDLRSWNLNPSIKNIRQLNDYLTLATILTRQPNIHRVSFRFAGGLSRLKGLIEQGLMSNLKSVEVFVVRRAEIYKGETERNAEEIAQFKVFCEERGLELDIKKIDTWQSQTVPNLLYEYLTVLPRGGSDWG